ncbi:MAG: hypothetical protein Q9157_002762 [Trypethelium eluteriae]
MSAKPLIWINGFPGVGKLTIAKALISLLESNRPILIDNHQLIDPVAADFPRDHPDYQSERCRQRNVTFTERVEHPDLQDQVVVFTDFQSNNELGRGVAREYEAAAQRSGRPFLPIYLECEVDENVRRVASAQRTNSGTTKLLDSEVLKGIRVRCHLYRFDEIKGISLDVSSIAPQEAAEALLEQINEILPNLQKHPRNTLAR